jgi:hypothetical protein
MKKANRESRPIPKDIGLATPKGWGQMQGEQGYNQEQGKAEVVRKLYVSCAYWNVHQACLQPVAYAHVHQSTAHHESLFLHHIVL